MKLKNLLSTAQVAEKLGVTTQTVLKLARNGELAYVALNNRLFRYQPEVVENYLKSKQNTPRRAV